MFTDFYITNKSFTENGDNIVFFQKKVTEEILNTTILATVKKCQYSWSHKVRIFWNFSCHFINATGSNFVYNFKMTYTRQKKLFLISKEGIVTIQQSYKGGCQIFNFEQIKGSKLLGVQIYRGKLLIGEQYFQGKNLRFQIDSVINLALYDKQSEYNKIQLEKIKSVLEVDFIGLKSIYITRNGDKNRENNMQVVSIEKW